ncbi:DMT family transporter [Clostridium sp. HCP1S3_B4]|uniref:DMT family transporter n=1 Tax=unclassified Clostridium TaxID=2614128 RepID=UPI003F8B6A7A
MIKNISKRNQGIICIISAAFFFALMNLFVKLSGEAPLMQKCFFRNIVALFSSLFIIGRMVKNKEDIKVPKGNFKYLFIRAFSGTAGLMCNFYAIDNLNISDASMLNKLSPFFATIFSIFVLKEVANKIEWSAIILAFTGALFVVKPSFNLDSFPAVIGVLSGLGAGLAYAYVRKLSKNGVKGPIIVFAFSLFSCAITLPKILFDYTYMAPRQIIFLLLAGIAATGGQFSITAAYAKAPAKEISVFDYTQVVFAALLGFTFLGEMPDIFSVIGYIIIIGVAIFKWLYNMKEDNRSN